MNNSDVVGEGFKPLKRTPTEPQQLPSKPGMNRGMSFNAETGEKESAQQLWDGSNWVKMARNRGMTMERSNTFIGASTIPEESVLKDEIICIVDPFSTGAHLAAEVCKQGYRCARIFSIWDSPVAALVQKGLKIDFCATVQFNDRLEDQEMALDECIESLNDLPFPIRAIIPGAETGVELADQLAHKMGLRTNGIAKSLARRNKYVMGETVRSAGVRAVTQARCTTEEEVIAFVKTLPGKDARCVVKPVQSAGSDDVFLCANGDEAVTAFKRIIGTMNGLGLMNECVLVQEFLKGKEYVIDKVSRDGVHKIVGIWEYEKRSVNGSHFVYFGMRLMNPNSEKMQTMVRYADKVLDALDIKHGPSHMEVMLDNWGTPEAPEWVPCLVEVGARCQGGEGTWLPMAKECIGYTPVEVTLDIYLEGRLWSGIDANIFPKRKAAREVDMVSRNGGIIRRLVGDAFIRNLKSFRSLTWDVKPGDYISKTIDCFTRPGCVQLVADTEEQVEADFEAIHDNEELGNIDYSVICPAPPAIGAVVIVDPFSSGANLAAMVLLWGYKLILVFSAKDSPVANLVTKGSKVEPTLLVQHDSTAANQDAALQQTIAAITGQGAPVLAIIPGAETGVELADKLANTYGTRANRYENMDCRRNKFKMQEFLAAQNNKIRTVQQELCKSEQEVRDFLTKLARTGTSKCVVKPNQSAGSDHILLCDTADEAVKAFHAIHGQLNGLGNINEGALVQEYLQGTEYAVDGVSRDGVYKVIAVWEYDKRSVNGANFVYYGMSLRDPATDPKVRAVVEYAREVVRGLKINQGASHMEVICDAVSSSADNKVHYSPCLVEVGTRCHGGEATWLPVAVECVGYSQLDATLNCFLRPDRFDSLPFEPTLHKQGTEAFLVSHESGTLKDIPGIEKVRALSSFRRMEMLTQPGQPIIPTIDCFSRPGSVQLVNASKEALAADYQAIRALERNGLFELIQTQTPSGQVCD